MREKETEKDREREKKEERGKKREKERSVEEAKNQNNNQKLENFRASRNLSAWKSMFELQMSHLIIKSIAVLSC